MLKRCVDIHNAWPLLAGCAFIGACAMAPSLGARAQQAGAAKPAEPQAFTFGDVQLSRYRTFSFELGKKAEVKGPNSTVDMVDEKTGAKGRLQAAVMTVYANPKQTNQVARVDADGNIRYWQSRPAENGKGNLVARITASKGTYNKLTGDLELTGPIRFEAEQPTADGKGTMTARGTASKGTYNTQTSVMTLVGGVTFRGEQPTVDAKATQWVDGSAESVVYDGAKNVVTMSEKVRGKLFAPDVMKAPANFAFAKVVYDLSARPYTFTGSADDDDGVIDYKPKPNKK